MPHDLRSQAAGAAAAARPLRVLQGSACIKSLHLFARLSVRLLSCCTCRPSFDAICDTLEGMLAQEQAGQTKLAALIQQQPHTVSPPALQQQPIAHTLSAAAAGAPAGSCTVPAPAAAGEAAGAGGASPGSPFSPFAAIADERFASGSTTNIQQT